MTLDRAVLAERVMAIDRHLRRVAERLPPSAQDLQPSTDASDERWRRQDWLVRGGRYSRREWADERVRLFAPARRCGRL